MNTTKSSLASKTLVSCTIAVILGSVAHADVTIEERMSVQGAGLMKMANMSGRTITTVSGDRARTDSDIQFESGLMRTLARGVGQTSEIVRLDQDKIFSLEPDKKTYTEISIAERRAEMQQAMEQMQKAQQSQQQAASGVDDSQCEWSPPKADVKQTGEKAAIAGYQAERVTITATQSCKDKSTGQVCDFGLSLDSWMAPGFEAAKELTDYQLTYAQKLGLNAVASRDFAERAETMFGRYKGIWSEVAVKMREIKGYPVKSSFALGVGGPQCESAQQAQAQGGAAGAPNIGGAIGGALGGLFGRKKEPEPQPAATPPPTAPNGLMSLMTVSTELVSVNRGSAPAGAFDVPAGFKKTSK